MREAASGRLGRRSGAGKRPFPDHSAPWLAARVAREGERTNSAGRCSSTEVEESGVRWGDAEPPGSRAPPQVDKGRWRAVFLGTHTPRLDEKGRLFLPAKFRDRLAGGLVVTRGQERCLFIFPMDEFVKVADQMRQAPTTSKAARDYMRVFLSGAS